MCSISPPPSALAVFDAAAEKLAAAFWPGPLTLVLKKRAGCPVAELATAGLDSIAVRVPQHPIALGILSRLGRPVVAPSANRSGHVSPTTAQHVMDDLGGRIDFIVDGGPDDGRRRIHHRRLSRTVPCCCGPGGLPRERIEAVLGEALQDAPAGSVDPDAPIAPGMIESHYAPRARLRLQVDRVNPGEALLAFGARMPPGIEHAALVLNLSPGGDLVEAATNLFSDLRTLDQADVATIAVMRVPEKASAKPSTTGLRAPPRQGRTPVP